MPGRTQWLLLPLGQRGYEVRRDRRHVRYVDDLEEAFTLVQSHKQDGDKVYLQADDGYREDVTRQVGKARRKHWRR